MPDNPIPPVSPPPPMGEIVLYQTEDGQTRVECRFADETLWLSQALIAELFQVTVPTVNEQLKNLHDEGELGAEGTIRKFRIVRREGGAVRKAEADARAEAEYEEFAARHRELMEAEAEQDWQEALEDAARNLPEKPRRKRPRG